jgi:uncharacterized protein YprB with RNaseH-like and TPR domain
MSLAARLDRLRDLERRARCPGETSPAPCAPAQDPAADALVERLRRLARVRPATRREPLPAVLANALQGELAAPGLLLCQGSQDMPGCAAVPAGAELPDSLELDGRDWVYIDTETTGLSSGVGNLAFMVGLARWQGGHRIVLKQFVLAGFSSERAMLEQAAAWVGGQATLVSYNGKRFDLPLLEGRYRAQRLSARLTGLDHLDLLYAVRRAFRGVWPDCRLQTAEQRLLGVHRVDDLPGAEAPLAWRDWLGRGATDGLRGVLAHNRQDLLSLALLHRSLAGIYRDGAGSAADLAAMARAWRRAGRTARELSDAARRTDVGQLSLPVDRAM